MASTIESVDNVSRPPPQDRVNPAERSSSERQGRQFKKELKKGLSEQQDEALEQPPADAVELTHEERSSNQDHEKRGRAMETDSAVTAPANSDRSGKTPDEHIDVKG